MKNSRKTSDDDHRRCAWRDGAGRLMKLGLFPGVSGSSIALGFIAFLGAAHIFIRTAKYRLDYYSDATAYVYFAKALATGRGFEGQLDWQPPLFPVVLSGYRLLGVEPSDVGRYLNIASFGLVVLVAGHWLYQFARSHLVVVGTSIIIISSYPLARVYSQLLTEVLFILMTLLALSMMGSYVSSRRSQSRFWLSIVFSALALFTRYMGVTVIFTGALLILTRRGSPARDRWKNAAIYSVLSSLPTALWIIRNQIIAGTLAGYRADRVGQSFEDQLTNLWHHMHLWITTSQDLGWLDICLWVAVALAGFEASKTFIPRSILPSSGKKIARSEDGSSSDKEFSPFLPFIVFIAVYIITLMIVSPHTTNQTINTRYLSPIYVPTAMMAAIGLKRFLVTTYQKSGVMVWKNSDGWGISYDRAAGSMEIVRWIIMGLILGIILVSVIRNVVLYVEVLTTYMLAEYQFY